MGNPGTKQVRLQQSLAAGPQQTRNSSLEDFLRIFSPARKSRRSPEDAYRASVPLQHRKRFAQFFTPMPIAELMVGWIAGIKPKTVLDPAVGPGIFPRVVLGALPDSEVTALDVDSHSLAAARLASAPDSRIRFLEQDFLTWDGPSEFDATIANPPYLRHHDFSYPPNVAASISARSGVRFSRLSNLYVFFIVEICRRLKQRGRAAILVPGEWVNANFGAGLKSFLLGSNYLRQLVYFSHAASQFEDALTTASILFLEKPKAQKPPSPIHTLFVSEGAEFSAIPRLLNGEHIN